MKLADQIILHLLKYGRRDPSEIMIPNFFYFMYEMDCFKLMAKTQFIIEYEVKISRADYFNDFKKNFKPYGRPTVYKHQQIAEGRASNRFFFIVPQGLISVKEVPHYAGLMYYEDGKITTVKPAPLIHSRKFEDYQWLATSLSWREERWRLKANKL